MTCDHTECGYTWPSIPVGADPVQGDSEPDSHFADRVAYAEKARSARFGGNLKVMEMRQEGRQEARDMEAYKTLRRQGLQPERINGSARLAATASDPAQIDIHARREKDRQILADRGLEFMA